MRYILLISFLSLLQLAHADTAPFSEPNNFSPWYDSNRFNQVINDIPSDKYPIIIEAGPLVGDGVVYRVLIKPKPSNNFTYRFIYGSDQNEFKKKNEEYNQLGFVLIHHQEIQLMLNKGHQAVWVKNDL